MRAWQGAGRAPDRERQIELTLRVAAQPGFGAAGELVPLERDAVGRVVALRLGGVTHRPLAEFLRRRDAASPPG